MMELPQGWKAFREDDGGIVVTFPHGGVLVYHNDSGSIAAAVLHALFDAILPAPEAE